MFFSVFFSSVCVCVSLLCLITPCNLSQMHIVSLKKDLAVQEATGDSEGIAVLGFFINVRPALQNIIPKSFVTADLSVILIRNVLHRGPL